MILVLRLPDAKLLFLGSISSWGLPISRSVQLQRWSDSALFPASLSQIPSCVRVGRLGVTFEFKVRGFHSHRENS
jgi:hypothetical protein